jgi:hypothetical protein
MQDKAKCHSPVLVALASLVLPGLGYFLVGQRRRGVVVGSALLLMFLLGILIAGVRVLEVPGFGEDERQVYGKLYVEYYENLRRAVQTTEPVLAVERAESPDGQMHYTISRLMRDGTVQKQPVAQTPDKPLGYQWILQASPRGEIANKIWFLPQALMGLPTAVGAYFSIGAGMASVAKSHARLADIGTLYTAVAGMLNLLAIIDAVSRCPSTEQHA